MLNLGEKTEYLPELAPGFEWRIGIYESDEMITLAIRDVRTNRDAVSHNIRITAQIKPEILRNNIIRAAESIAQKARHWNKDHVAMVNEIIESLTPPKDDAVTKVPDNLRIVKVGDTLRLAPEVDVVDYVYNRPEAGVTAPPTDPNEPRPRS